MKDPTLLRFWIPAVLWMSWGVPRAGAEAGRAPEGGLLLG